MAPVAAVAPVPAVAPVEAVPVTAAYDPIVEPVLTQPVATVELGQPV